MKILLVNHGTANVWGGGDGVQMRETGKRLGQRGHHVVAVNSDTPNTKDYDIVHIFNCRTIDSLKQQIAACRESNTAIVISPIWVSIMRALWGSRASCAVLDNALTCNKREAEIHLEALRNRAIQVKVPEGVVKYNGETNYANQYHNIGNLLNQADGILPNSWLELQAIRTDLNWFGDCFEIAYYGADPKIFLDTKPDEFRQKTGINMPFVMQAGRIEPAKNQAMLCWALKDTDIKIVLIGSKERWPSYADLCSKISGDRLLIIDHLPQKLLASAYSAASVHALPSWMETCGLVSLEAGLSGTPVVGSSFGHELEYLKHDCWYCDPADPASIKSAIFKAIEAGKSSKKVVNLKQRIISEYNWELTVEATLKLYEKVINQRKR